MKIFTILLTILLIASPAIAKTYHSIGIKTITAYRAITAECGNNRGYGAYGRRIAIDGKPLGRFCANNYLPKGTKIVIPKISGNTVWTVEDRLAKKYGHRIDLLIHKDSIGIGKRNAEVWIVGEK